MENHTDVLYVLESAVPAAKSERPDKPAIILISMLIAFVFSCFLVLVNDRKNIAWYDSVRNAISTFIPPAFFCFPDSPYTIRNISGAQADDYPFCMGIDPPSI